MARIWIEESELAAMALSRESLKEIDSVIFIDGVSNVGFYPAISPSRSVYDELNNSGMFMQLRSDSVRLKIVEYYSFLDFTLSQLNYFRQDVNQPEKFAVQDFYAVYDSTVDNPVMLTPQIR